VRERGWCREPAQGAANQCPGLARDRGAGNQHLQRFPLHIVSRIGLQYASLQAISSRILHIIPHLLHAITCGMAIPANGSIIPPRKSLGCVLAGTGIKFCPAPVRSPHVHTSLVCDQLLIRVRADSFKVLIEPLPKMLLIGLSKRFSHPPSLLNEIT
jgi:hypothetical protein